MGTVMSRMAVIFITSFRAYFKMKSEPAAADFGRDDRSGRNFPYSFRSLPSALMLRH